MLKLSGNTSNTTMENQLDPFEKYLGKIEENIKQESLPEKLGKLPENLKIEAVSSLTAIAIIKEAIGVIINEEDKQKKQEEDPFYLKYPFINHLISRQLGKTKEFNRERIKSLSTQMVSKVIRQLKDKRFIQGCYREFGIKGEVDINFESPEQQNAARIFITILEKVIWIQTSQESLNVFGVSVMEGVAEEPDPIQEFYREVLSSEQDLSGIDYLKRHHIPHLREAYLQSLASQSSPKLPPKTEEEKIAQILEEKMSPTAYKDWQVAAVITKIYEDTREKIRQEVIEK